MDSTEVPVYGRQEQSPYNGHFESTCYHPPLLFDRERDCLAATLRPGNVHSAEGWEELLLPEIERQTVAGQGVGLSCRRGLRQAGDPRGAGRTESEVRHPPSGRRQSGAQGFSVAEAASGQAELQAGGPPQKLFLPGRELDQGTAGGGKGGVPLRGVVPAVGFIVTNFQTSSRAVVRFYNKRGTAEQWIKEGKQAVALTRLSCHRFRANEVRLWLSLIAYNLGNLWRRLALPAPIGKWSLTSLQQRLVKTGGRLIQPARYYWLLLAESHLTRRLFAGMLRKVAALPSPAG
jgi:hypothetical protein